MSEILQFSIVAKNLLCSAAFIVEVKERERESKESNEGSPHCRCRAADVVIHKPISGHVPCDIIQACHVLHIYSAVAMIVIVHTRIIFSNFMA
jgi:hypothetical protein